MECELKNAIPTYRIQTQETFKVQQQDICDIHKVYNTHVEHVCMYVYIHIKL